MTSVMPYFRPASRAGEARHETEARDLVEQK
jgi:hypothetical protein